MRDLRLEVVGGVATLSINRPRARNALALQTMAELDDALETVRTERARVLVIRGAGDKAFCAGGDIKELEQIRSEEEAAAMAHRMRATLDRIPQLAIPVIAGLNGDAFGPFRRDAEAHFAELRALVGEADLLVIGFEQVEHVALDGIDAEQAMERFEG